MLVAEGRDEVPSEIGEFDRRRLQDEVRRILRERMVRLIARAIAVQLHGEFGKKVEDNSHAGT